MQIRLLGEFSVIDNGTPVEGLQHARLQSLLAYLIVHHEAPQSRARIAFTLWPDHTDKQAQTNLRNTLFRLRRALPDADAYLIGTREILGWRQDAPAEVDLLYFDNALTAAEEAESTRDKGREGRALEQAVASYRGDLLPDLYDEWVLAARDGYRVDLLDALGRLMDLAEDSQDYGAAVSWGQRILKEDALHEETYQRLMRLARRNGNRALALRLYHQCAASLRTELDVEPATVTVQLYREILDDAAAADGNAAADAPDALLQTEVGGHATPPLIGRDAELEAMASALAQIAQARPSPSILILEGEAGIGKTRLAEAAQQKAAAQGYTILTARCFRSDRLALSAVTAWLRQAELDHLEPYVRTEIGRLLPELEPNGSGVMAPEGTVEPWQQQRFFQALVQTLQSQRKPLLLLLDDLQWADPETLNLLSLLLRQANRERIACLMTLRSEEKPHAGPLVDFLNEQARESNLSQLRVTPLNEIDSANLAAAVRGGPLSGEEASTLNRFTEGNPLFIVETMRSDIQLAALENALSDATTPLPLPPQMATVLSARLNALSTSARRVAESAAVIGRSFDYAVLLSACEQEEDTVLRALDELWHRQIIAVRTVRDDLYDFSHDHLRHVVYDSLSPMQRSALHRRVAMAMIEQNGEDPGPASGRIAFHLATAGDRDAAIPFHVRAAQHAARQFTHEEVVWHCRQGLRLEGSAESTGARPRAQRLTVTLYREMARANMLLARSEEAADAFAAALAHADEPLERADLLRSAGDNAMASTNFAAATEAFASAEQTLQQAADHDDAAWWRCWLDVKQSEASLHYYQSRLDDLAAVLEEISRPMALHGTANQKADYFGALTQLNFRRKRYVCTDETLDSTAKALYWAETSGDEIKIALHQFGFGFALLLKGDLEAALSALTDAYQREARIGNAPVRNQVLIYLLVTLRKLGRVEESADLVDESLVLSTRLGSPYYIGAAEGHAAWLAYRRGDEAAAQHHAEKAAAIWEGRPYPFQWIGLMPLLAVAYARDDLDRAGDAARAMLEPTQQILPEALTNALAAMAAADTNGRAAYRELIRKALAHAHALGYL